MRNFYANNSLPKAEVLPRSLAEDVRDRTKVTYGVNDPDVLYTLRHRAIEPVKVAATR